MSGAGDMLRSERGVFCCLALAAVTVLASLRVVDSEQWLSFVKYLLGAFVVSKTITTAVETYVTKQPQIPPQIPQADVVRMPDGIT